MDLRDPDQRGGGQAALPDGATGIGHHRLVVSTSTWRGRKRTPRHLLSRPQRRLEPFSTGARRRCPSGSGVDVRCKRGQLGRASERFARATRLETSCQQHTKQSLPTDCRSISITLRCCALLARSRCADPVARSSRASSGAGVFTAPATRASAGTSPPGDLRKPVPDHATITRFRPRHQQALRGSNRRPIQPTPDSEWGSDSRITGAAST